MSIDLAAYGEDPDSFVRITSVNPKTGNMHVDWGKEIYRNCHRKMKGHTTPQSLTRVCIVGNGDFSGTLIQAVTSKDWFPVKEFLGNQVEEVSFNCGLDQIFNQKTGKITPVKSRMHFPLDTEASKGQRIQIELSCHLTKREVEQEMKKMAEVMRGLHHDPNAVIENAVSESQSECGKEIDSPTCKNLRATVGKLVGGELSQKMKALVSGIVTYRGTPLCGGYETYGGKAPSFIAVNEESNKKNDEDINEEDIPSDEEMKKAIPHCYSKLITKYNILKNIHSCLDEIKAFKAILEKKFNGHIKFNPDGSALVNGRDIWKWVDPEIPLEKIAAKLHEIEVQTIQNQAQEEINDGSIVDGSSQEWTDAYTPSHISSGQYFIHSDQGVGFYMPGNPPENYSDICGLDVACWKRNITLDALTSDTILSLPKGKCYQATGKVTIENDKPKIELLEVPASSCGHLLDYLESQ